MAQKQFRAEANPALRTVCAQCGKSIRPKWAIPIRSMRKIVASGEKREASSA